ncbi:MAG: hypothetical protein ACREXR_00655 [Gammaproteobacteria bacterium]
MDIAARIFKPCTHKAVRAYVIETLKRAGAYAMAVETTTVNGVFDVFSIYKGRSTWIEIKIAPDKLSTVQRRWATRIVNNDGECFVLTIIPSAGWKFEVSYMLKKEFLKSLDMVPIKVL